MISPRTTEAYTIAPRPRPDVVLTLEQQVLAERWLAYLGMGFTLHFQGPSGVGKTTMALYLAHRLGRPIVLIHGDDQYSTRDLLGRHAGYHRRTNVDNFVHSVYKLDDWLEETWIDGRLTTACRHGYTLVYDEFTRSRPETNNVLLAALEEGILELPLGHRENNSLTVHPQFRVIFTSNPEEYAGVHPGQNALLDRVLTIYLEELTEEAQIKITEAKARVSPEAAARVVGLVRAVRRLNLLKTPTLRPAIRLARIGNTICPECDWHQDSFREVCLEVLLGACEFRQEGPGVEFRAWRQIVRQQLEKLLDSQ